MARKAVHLNLDILQRTIDEEKVKPDAFTKGIMAFYRHCSKIYNDSVKPEIPLTENLIYLRVVQGRLSCDYQNTVSPKVKELYEGYKPLLEEINQKWGTNIDLQMTSSKGLVTNLKDSPSLSLDNLKIFLIGLGIVAGADNALLHTFVDESLTARAL